MNIVALGGGHGLAASLRALRHAAAKLDLAVTAIVTVGDDGGSSGRLRSERAALPPGDLRQALAALADDEATATLFQYRFEGSDALAGHPVGNLVLCGLMELCGDPVAALDQAGKMLRVGGRVLPMSREPVAIEADIRGANPTSPDAMVTVRGQRHVAVARGRVETVRLIPAAPAACAEAVEAVRTADWLLFGPGSWYTSVIPHLLIPELGTAIVASPARRLVMLNLAVEPETAGLSLPDHLAALSWYLPELRIDVVLADEKAVGDPAEVRRGAESLGARLELAPVAAGDGSAQHDPVALATALVPTLGSAR